ILRVGFSAGIEEEALAVSSTTPTLCTSEIKRRRSGSTPVCSLSAPGPLHLIGLMRWIGGGCKMIILSNRLAK
ncbi:unnamed protein product, partial [Musa banksii]